ncbi:hypothetical protein RB595_009534 [Gaeumannomyces hyphopodioides]
MAVDSISRIPTPAPRNLMMVANAAKKIDARGAHNQVDEQGFLFGRVIVISLRLKVVTEKYKEAKPGGGSTTRKMTAKRWQYRCANRGELRDEARRARKVLGTALPESAANKRLREQSARVLDDLGLGADFPVFFSEDMVMLDGYVQHLLDRSCPGLAPEFRRFLGRFRRHLLPAEQFNLLFDNLGKEHRQSLASPAVDYHELLFPPAQVTVTPGGAMHRSEVEREVVVCVNTAEHDTDLGSDGLFPSQRAPEKYLATTGRCGYGGEIARIQREYQEVHRQCVSDDRLAAALACHRMMCVFRRPRR